MNKKKRIVPFIKYIITLFFAVALASEGFGEGKIQLDEKGKLFSIAQSLEFRKRPYIKEDESFCKSFLGALKAKREIEFIEPIIRTDDYNDPRLQTYLGKCPKLHLNKSVAFEPRIWEYAKTLPEEERERLGTVTFTNMDFRLYHVDVDNNPKNGKEYLFYGGGGFSPRLNMAASFTNYLLVDFEKCEIKGSGQVRDTVNYLTKKPTGDYNFVIRFRGKTYILELDYYPNEDSYYVPLYEWRIAKINKKLSAFLLCSYESQKPEKGGNKK
ncbi:MAG: hypothetical protein FJZ16_10310 [Candidatus Omnitrophica bacterium]|nr:hypothetical protein [Candidatus Omnitrophota bacterium]